MQGVLTAGVQLLSVGDSANSYCTAVLWGLGHSGESPPSGGVLLAEALLSCKEPAVNLLV